MQDTDYNRAVDYIYDLGSLGWKPGLERFAALCERLGNPQDSLRFIHIGGTNGKGSTTAMVCSILKSAGYRVGAYYSPYVYNIRERVQLDGGMVSKSAFVRHIDTIRPHAAALGETDLGHPTEFEVKTALGFLYFLEQEADFVVLEVGLGGRLDATNIVTPLASAITNVTLDHMDRLGNTIPEIAAEKAGIVKEDGHLVTASQDPDALDVIRRTCEERRSILWHVRQNDASGVRFDVIPIEHGRIEFTPPIPSEMTRSGLRMLDVHTPIARYEELTLGLRGDFQRINAATAVGVAEALCTKGISIPESAIRSGLASAYIPGRLEVLQERPTVLIDGAHNIDAARVLAEALRTSFSYDRLILVMGMVEGHSMHDVVGTLAPMADKFIATIPNSDRAAPASLIANAARVHCSDVVQVEMVTDAIHLALESAEENDLVCITGSFYLIGEVPRPTG